MSRPPSAPRPAPVRRSNLGPLLVLLAGVVVVAGLVVGAIVLSQRDDAKVAASKRPSGTTVPATTTTAPRVDQVQLLAGYCQHPGEAWPEVPPHVAGQPSRAWVEMADYVTANGIDPPRNGSYSLSSFPRSASTVLSPHTDGAFSFDDSVLTRTRAVACVTHEGLVGTGRQCPYWKMFATTREELGPYELAGHVWKMTVYELHSGGVLVQGEIRTDTSHCPKEVEVAPGDTQVSFPITEEMVLGWLDAHFVDGAPR